MRTLVLLSVLSGIAYRFPPGANPSISTPEYAVEGRLTSEPITDHPTVLQTTITAQPGHWLDGTASFDVGGGCCFEQVHYDKPKLERCANDASKICRAVFEVPYRLAGAGQAIGAVTFAICAPGGCGVRKVSVAVPYRTRD